MIVKFDALNRYETPKLTLCNPGSTYNNGTLTNVVGILTDDSDMEIVFNFNSSSELNFVVTKVKREDASDNEHTYSLYKSIQNRRLVFVEDIGYFVIKDVNEVVEGEMRHKEVSAKSVDVELEDRNIPYIKDGTYRFSTDSSAQDPEIGLFDKIVSTLPLWTIGYVDEDVQSKYRTFEDVDVKLNCLSFMISNMQDAYECIFIFDIISRTINVYSQDNYVRDADAMTDIHITNDDIIESLNITENADDLYTAISVMGDDNLTISAINPLGTNTIYRFDYYLDWMTDGLSRKVIDWQDDVKGTATEYYNKNLSLFNHKSTEYTLLFNLDRLSIQKELYQRARDNLVSDESKALLSEYNDAIVKNGGTPIPTNLPSIDQTKTAIDNKISSINYDYRTYSNQLEALERTIAIEENEISDIRSDLSFEKNFTAQELAELNTYIFEGNYTDEYVTITESMTYNEQFEQMKILYDRAEAQLVKISEPVQEFSIDMENFIFHKEFEHQTSQLKTGCLINVELEQGDVAKLFLSNMTVNYEDHSLSMTFGNRFNKYDTKSLFEDALGSVSKTANTISYVKDLLYPIKSGEIDDMQRALQSSRDITMANALSSTGEVVTIDGSGYTGRKKLENGEYSPKQIKITGNSIVFTNDNWQSSDIAIGEIIFDGQPIYGINAKNIIGDIIIGEKGIIRSAKDGKGNTIQIENGKMEIYHEKNGVSELVGLMGGTLSNYGDEDVPALAIDSEGVFGIAIDGDPYVIMHDGTVFDETPIVFLKPVRFDKALYFGSGSYSNTIMNLFGTLITSGNFSVTGNLSVSGTKNRIVNTDNYGSVKLNAVESASAVFCDIGSGTTDETGVCEILFDSRFMETIDDKYEYSVLITNINGLEDYSITKNQEGFIVNGSAGANFDWVVFARQKGYADLYLENSDDVSSYQTEEIM